MNNLEVSNQKAFYAEKLLDVRWRIKRLRIVERDKICQQCRSGYRLHVHHKRYIKNKEPWEYEDEDLITLCQHCHWQEHNKIWGDGFPSEFDDIKNWYVVLINKHSPIVWHVEYLEEYFEHKPSDFWRIVGIFPSNEEAMYFIDKLPLGSDGIWGMKRHGFYGSSFEK